MVQTTRRQAVQMIAAAAAGAHVSSREGAAQTAVPAREKIVVFDVNETLLDVDALAPLFERSFGDTRIGQEWFSNVVLYSQVTTIAGPYANFGTIARASLEMTAAARGIRLAPADRDAILHGLVSLPAHPDVRAGLETLRSAGFRLVTLTNSAPAAVHQQLKNASLSTFFEHAFSVDTVQQFKPAPAVYRLVASELNVDVSQLRLVAAHAWDVLGAMRAGSAAAFVARHGKALYPLADPPDIIGPTLREVAAEIVRRDRPL